MQSQILAQAGNAMDSADLAQADALLQLAGTLGSSLGGGCARATAASGEDGRERRAAGGRGD